jgi:hypothetical protein
MKKPTAFAPRDFETDVTRPVDDGRNIDPRMGTLSGEGAHQQVERIHAGRPTPTAEDVTGDTYYGLPLLKETVWEWPIPAYFYVGGLAGASAALAAAALLRRESLVHVIRAGRYIAFGGSVVSAALLIKDLGRPMRFIYMLRVFRPSSPMNVGTWILSAFGACAFGAVALPGRLGDAAGVGAGFFGLPLSSYTAVLIANTAVPLWQGTRNALPVLFVASAASGAASAFELLNLPAAEARTVRRFAVIAKLADIAGAMAVEREANTVERVGRPLRKSPLWKAAKALSLASLVVSAIPISRKPRWLRIAGGVCGTLGALATRFGIFEAGRQSARDPQATFDQQRAGQGGGALAPT